ncbi:tRNA uridine-5-carboxymethylaminomethyl(34) synthesis GTPase MnmE [Heminiphilus faecis]|uniref:tRNA modification GTPase MnmE n=2 Tax=Heminiphilus faecis TaxID=2601703 RepID=A0ABV4CW41_9BACT
MMEDTICAVSTPPGIGGIAVVRISGKDAVAIVDKVWRGRELSRAASHTAHLGEIVEESGEVLDQAVATVFRAPKSFTGEDVVEVSVHGSRWIQREVVNLLVRNGCRVAMPGEFTRRAYASGRMDLAEAEAVADMIASSSRAAHRLAVSQMKGDFSRCLKELRDRLLELASMLELELDFSEEEVEFASREALKELAAQIYATVSRLVESFSTGSAIKSGIPVAIVGATNAGKSTLLNRLVGDNRAIVSDIHGTTRDIIEDIMEIDGLQFQLVDTAGLRDTDDVVESLGIERTMEQIDRASIVIWVVDSTSGRDEIADTWERIHGRIPEDAHLIVAWNKSDALGDGAMYAPECSLHNIMTSDESSDSMSSGNGGELSSSTVTQQLSVDIRPFEGTVSEVHISAATGSGVEELCAKLTDASGIGEWQDSIVVTNARHYEALVHSQESVSRVIEGLSHNLSGDFIAQDIRETIHYLGEITGEITTDDILGTIFSRFCIGK